MSPVLPLVALERPIRNRRLTGLLVITGWLCACGMIATWLILAVRFAAKEPLQTAVVGVFFVPLMLAFVWVARRAGRMELRVEPQSLLVRNFLRCHTIPRSEVDGFRAGTLTLPRNPQPGIVVILHNGNEVPVWALAYGSLRFTANRMIGRLAPLADDLNALLASQTRHPAAESCARGPVPEAGG